MKELALTLPQESDAARVAALTTRRSQLRKANSINSKMLSPRTIESWTTERA